MEGLGTPQASPTPPPSTSPAEAFNRLLAGLPQKRNSEATKFVKKLDDIPVISLPPETPIQVALSLADRALIGQFTGLWPSPKSTESWVNRNWAPLIKESVTSYFLGRGYFLFEFTSKDDKDLIFQNGPYFMGPQGLYLNKWTPDFDPAVDVPKAVPVWVRLPNLPVHCWNGDSLRHIGNALGKFIDRANTKDQFDCARICVEVDLEVGLPEAITLQVGSWTHLQKLDYEQLPFKCRKCHVYGHFARGCPTNKEAMQGQEDGWNQVKRSKYNPKSQKSGGPNGKGSNQVIAQQTPLNTGPGNKFGPLSSQPENTQEVGVQEETEAIMETETQKAAPSSKGTSSATNKGTSAEDPQGKAIEVEGEEQETDESEEEGEIGESQTSVRRSLRGRKTDREKREQETHKEKLQGSQPTLEKLLAPKTKILKNQTQGSKGALQKQK
jgi:hypothetical protein